MIHGASTDHAPPVADAIRRVRGHIELFLTTQDITHLNHAIEVMECTIAAPTTSDHSRASLLAQLSTIRFDKYQQFGVLDDLDKGIDAGTKALDLTAADDPRRMGRWSHMSTMFQARYGCLDALDDLVKAINASQHALAADSPDHRFHGARLSNLANQYYKRYTRAGGLDDLHEAIVFGAKARQCGTQGGSSQARMLCNLGDYYYSRFELLEYLPDLDNAIRADEKAEAIAMETPDDPVGEVLFHRLRLYRYHRELWLGVDADDGGDAIPGTGQPTPLGDPTQAERSSICISRQVGVACPPHYSLNSSVLGLLFNHYVNRLNRLAAVGNFDKAIEAGRMAIAITAAGSCDRRVVLTKLGDLFHRRFKKLRSNHDFEHGVAILEQVVGLTAHDPTQRAHALGNLSSLLVSRYDMMGALPVLEQAIATCKEAVSSVLPDDQDRFKLFGHLCRILYLRFERLGALQDLEEAIAAGSRAVNQIPAGHQDRELFLINLAVQLCDRYRWLGSMDDLEQAIATGEEALSAFDTDSIEQLGGLDEDGPSARLPGHDTRDVILSYFGIFYHFKFMRSGDLDDLEKAIHFAIHAVARLSLDNPARSRCFANLGDSLYLRYERLGSLADLENSIQAYEDGLPASGQHTPANYYSNWGGLHGLLFRRVGNIDRLNRAIELTEKGAAEMAPGFPGRVSAFHALSLAYEDRFHQLDVVEDLEKAISSIAESIAGTVPGDLDLASRLDVMSCLLHRRYHRVGALEDLHNSIMSSEDAVRSTPVDHQNRADILFALSKRLECKSAKLKSLEEQDEWPLPIDHTNINRFLQGLVSTASEQNMDCIILSTAFGMQDQLNIEAFAKFFYKDSEPRTSISELNSAIELSVEAWRCNRSPPRDRIRAARHAASMMAVEFRWDEAGSLLADAVRILSTVSPRILTRHDQEHSISEFTRFPGEAVSCAFLAGSTASHGLSLLELSRGIIMGFAIDCRTDVSELRLVHPDIFDKFHRLRIEIDAPLGNQLWRSNPPPREFMGAFHHHDAEDQRRRRAFAIHEMEETLDYIRQLPGFEGFQLPPSAATLMTIAAEGPIVIFNCTKFRSDAIILTSSGINLLPLPTMVLSTVEDWMAQLIVLIRGKLSTLAARNQQLSKMLLWLWEVAVLPVFEELGFGAVGDEDLPRVWWIGVGILAQAPFHAAGDHSSNSTCNTLSRAISSYIPTIKALSYTRQKKLEINSADSRLLMVTMAKTPDTPGPPVKKWKPLVNAMIEAGEIEGVVHPMAAVTQLHSPSVTQVLHELPSYHAIHFACHGVSDSKRPSDSHLLLVGDNPLESGKLTVAAIADMNLHNAQIAYLSACSSADNASASLLDESIHIASGFQLAGFSHVLATLWVSNDLACRQVAVQFYRLLFDGTARDRGHRVVSASFHHAVKGLRERTARQPITWVPFIHTGA